MKNSAAITHTTESLCRKEQPEIILDFHFSRRKYGGDRFEGLRGFFGQSFRFWSWVAENLHEIYLLWHYSCMKILNFLFKILTEM